MTDEIDQKPPTKAPISWVGTVVRFRREMVNGVGSLPAGTLAFVTSTYSGLDVRTAPCSCCGLSLKISRVPYTDVTFVRRALPRLTGRKPWVPPPDRWWEEP